MTIYDLLVFVHLLLFVFWLGADVGVFVLGQHFRRRDYSLPERLTILRLLVITDMVPRTAWALMVPVSVSIAAMRWAVLPQWLVLAAWATGAFWLWLVWDAHMHDQTPRAAGRRKVEFWLKILLMLFYLLLGTTSLVGGAPMVPTWLAMKAVMFGMIFAAAIMIDVAFKPVGGLLGRLIAEGSSDQTERPLLSAMNRTRLWVWLVYALLLATAFLGNVKPI